MSEFGLGEKGAEEACKLRSQDGGGKLHEFVPSSDSSRSLLTSHLSAQC